MKPSPVQPSVRRGWVRDLYLERPSNDIDIVVIDPERRIERPGIAIAETLKGKIGKKVHIAIYRNFGTAQLKHKNLEIEFVGARIPPAVLVSASAGNTSALPGITLPFNSFAILNDI